MKFSKLSFSDMMKEMPEPVNGEVPASQKTDFSTQSRSMDRRAILKGIAGTALGGSLAAGLRNANAAGEYSHALHNTSLSEMETFVPQVAESLGIIQEDHVETHHGEFDIHDVNDRTALLVAGLFGGIIAGAGAGKVELGKKTAIAMNTANIYRLASLYESGTPANKELATKEATELAKGYGILFGVLVPMTEVAHYVEMSPKAIISDEELIERVPFEYDGQLFDVGEVEGYFSENPLTETTSISEVERRLELLSKYAIVSRGRLDGINTAIAPVFSTYISASYANSLLEDEYRLHHEIRKLKGILDYASSETRIVGDIPADERRIIADRAVEEVDEFFHNPFGVHNANQTREANTRGAKGPFGDPPIPYQIALNAVNNPLAIGLSQVAGTFNSELLNQFIAKKYISQLHLPEGMSQKDAMSIYNNVYKKSIGSTYRAILEYFAGKGLIKAGEVFNKDITYKRKRMQYVEQIVVPRIKEMQGLEGQLSEEEWDAFYTTLDSAIEQDAILLDHRDIIIKLARQFKLLAQKEFRVPDQVVQDNRLSSMQRVLEHVGNMTGDNRGHHIDLDIDDMHQFSELAGLDFSPNEILGRIRKGDIHFFERLGRQMKNIVTSNAAHDYSAQMQEYFENFSPDLDRTHGHDDEGHDTEQILEDPTSRLTPHNFQETILSTKITDEQIPDDQLGRRLMDVVNGQDSFDALVSDLKRLPPDRAIKFISNATRRAAGPATDKLSHKTKEVVGAITTQLAGVESLVHLAEKVVAKIEDPTIKRNVVVAIGGAMTMGADNIAAYLFMRKMFMSIDKEVYGQQVYKENPLMMATADTAAIQVAILMGAGTRIGNAPALGQRDMHGVMKQSKEGAFDRLEVVEQDRTLGKSAKNGYTLYCAAASVISANAILEGGKQISNPKIEKEEH